MGRRSAAGVVTLALVLGLEGCGGGHHSPRRAVDRPPVVRAHGPCPVSPGRKLPPRYAYGMGDGPAYAVGLRRGVLELAPPARFGSHRWAGEKVLWVVAPGPRRQRTVTGQRLDAPGVVRFDDGDVPPARLALAPSQRKVWVDTPSYTRVASPGCYAWTVGGGVRPQRIVFRAVRLAHWSRGGDLVAGRRAEAMERALVEPRGAARADTPSSADCRAPTAAERRRSPFGRSRRVFSCALTAGWGAGRYDVQFLGNGCSVAEARHRDGPGPAVIQTCAA